MALNTELMVAAEIVDTWQPSKLTTEQREFAYTQALMLMQRANSFRCELRTLEGAADDELTAGDRAQAALDMAIMRVRSHEAEDKALFAEIAESYKVR